MPSRSSLAGECFFLGALVFGQAVPAAGPTKGTQISIRTVDPIHSKQGEVGQNYRCTVDAPVMAEMRAVVAKGADCVLQIVEMKSAGKLAGANQLKLVLSQVRIGESLVSIATEPTAMTGKSKGKSTGIRSGIGAAAGAGIGGLIGGGKGAAIGAGAGAAAGAASSAMTSGPEINVPSETVLVFTVQ